MLAALTEAADPTITRHVMRHVLSYLVLVPAVLFAAWVLTKERGVWAESPYRRNANVLAILGAAVLILVSALIRPGSRRSIRRCFD